MKKPKKSTVPEEIEARAQYLEDFLLTEARRELTLEAHKEILISTMERVKRRHRGQLDSHEFLAEATTDCYVNGYICGAMRAFKLILAGVEAK